MMMMMMMMMMLMEVRHRPACQQSRTLLKYCNLSFMDEIKDE